MWSYTVASLAKRTAAPTRFRLCSVDRISQFIGGSLSFNTYVVYRRDILLNMLAMNASSRSTRNMRMPYVMLCIAKRAAFVSVHIISN